MTPIMRLTAIVIGLIGLGIPLFFVGALIVSFISALG